MLGCPKNTTNHSHPGSAGLIVHTQPSSMQHCGAPWIQWCWDYQDNTWEFSGTYSGRNQIQGFTYTKSVLQPLNSLPGP